MWQQTFDGVVVGSAAKSDPTQHPLTLNAILVFNTHRSSMHESNHSRGVILMGGYENGDTVVENKRESAKCCPVFLKESTQVTLEVRECAPILGIRSKFSREIDRNHHSVPTHECVNNCVHLINVI